MPDTTGSDGGFAGGSFDASASLDAASSSASLGGALGGLQARTDNLVVSTNALARAMSQAFISATAGGKQLDTVLQGLALRISNLAVTAALKPVTTGIASGLNQFFSGLFSPSSASANSISKNAAGAIKPFAAGGIIGTPTYFPLTTGGVGLAGEAGPEAIVPLARGADGRLGIASSGGGAPANVTINIATPDADSFRRSEVYLTGQIARAVARGQRGL
jgi:phage-related minor tail protein